MVVNAIASLDMMLSSEYERAAAVEEQNNEGSVRSGKAKIARPGNLGGRAAYVHTRHLSPLGLAMAFRLLLCVLFKGSNAIHNYLIFLLISSLAQKLTNITNWFGQEHLPANRLIS